MIDGCKGVVAASSVGSGRGWLCEVWRLIGRLVDVASYRDQLPFVVAMGREWGLEMTEEREGDEDEDKIGGTIGY